MLISAKGEFPRSIISEKSGYMLNGIVYEASLPGFTVGEDGAQIYVLVGPQQDGQNQNIREAQIITFQFSTGFQRLDTSAIAHHGRDAAGVLIALDVSFEVRDADGTHTCKLLGEYVSGDAMTFQIAETTKTN